LGEGKGQTGREKDDMTAGGGKAQPARGEALDSRMKRGTQ